VVGRKAAVVVRTEETGDTAEAHSNPAADNSAGTVGRAVEDMEAAENMEAAEHRETAVAGHWGTAAVPPDLTPYRNCCRTFYQAQLAPNN